MRDFQLMGNTCRTALLQAPVASKAALLQPAISGSMSKDALLAQGPSTLPGEQNVLGCTSRQTKRMPEERAMGTWQTRTRMEKLALQVTILNPT